MIHLSWHPYNYFPYERELALREVRALLDCGDLRQDDAGLFVPRQRANSTSALRLTYFSGLRDDARFVSTVQANLEEAARAGRSRQATRYSVHGLHEYKGKFNPQVARAILNIHGISEGKTVFDPFCGSGTTLVECAHLGAKGFGTDINPMAVFLSNAKLDGLALPAEQLSRALRRVLADVAKRKRRLPVDDARGEFLSSWFDQANLLEVETLRRSIEAKGAQGTTVLLAIASDLLRDYSLQEPQDLRIRRRTSPLPGIPFIQAFEGAAERFLSKLAASQAVLGIIPRSGRVVLGDNTSNAIAETGAAPFDMALTSPPYAMALPYIDTQRLSLVWLGLTNPGEVRRLEAELIGSREMATSERRLIEGHFRDKSDALPRRQAALCRQLAKALGPEDGFRRKAVPTLLYRYFVSMRDSFASVLKSMKPGAPYALIVGHNHTILSGHRFDIDTPSHLMDIAQSVGWEVVETTELQTYRRYGLHAGNAVNAETLLIVRRPA